MCASVYSPSSAEHDQQIVLGRIGWDQYLAISDAQVDRPGPRMVYWDGSLSLLVKSRLHDWYAERLGQLVAAVAHGCGLFWEDAGEATYRRHDLEVGVEGDKTYYFGDHAEVMKGPVDIDLTVQPPPDLAIEVEVTHPADMAVSNWERLGVPEIWRFNPKKWTQVFRMRQHDGHYEAADRSAALPVLTPCEALGLLRLADEMGTGRWYGYLADWAAGQAGTEGRTEDQGR